MLRIIVPIVTMIAGVVGGLFLGARYQNRTLTSFRFVGRILALMGRLLARCPGIVRTGASHTWRALRRLGRVLKAFAQQVATRTKSVRTASSRREHGSEGAEKLRRCLDHVKLPGQTPDNSAVPDHAREPVDTTVLNCRARIGREPNGESWHSVLILDLCGTIESPDEEHEVCLEVTIQDVTDDPAEPLPALSRPKRGPVQQTSPFVFQTSMGKLCHRTTVLEDWTLAAQIQPKWFVLPRQGHRDLRFSVAIVSRQTGASLASAICVASYENIEIGYVDVEDNIQRARTLGVGLAFSVAAAKEELLDTEIDVIYGWVRTNFGSGDASTGARLELERALQKTATFFRRGGQLNVCDICAEIVEMAPMIGRLDILDLCLRVAGAKGQVTAPELTLLKDLAGWLQVDRTRLRAMVEKRLPVSMHQEQDEEMILGLTAEMNSDEARHQLNREYAKWSSRVISSDPAIRKQADEMLNLIANARTQYVGANPSK